MPRDLIQHPDPLPIAHPDTVRVDPDAEVLLRAAEIIEERGWNQFHMNVDGGPTCLVGALEIALVERAGRYDATMYAAQQRLARRMGFPDPNPSVKGMIWSDQQSSGEPVIALLRGAAAR